LIDEPELHLHPQLQNILFSEFANSDFQTIYTTQSDCFVNVAEWQSISRFKPDFHTSPLDTDLNQVFEGKKLSEHLDEIKVWHQHQSVFFREDNQIFFSRKCLLVEGPSEKYGLPTIAQKIGKTLGNITIVSCNGKGKIPYYQLLCRSFNIPYFTLFDLDGHIASYGSNKRSLSWADPSARYTFKTNFEALLGINTRTNHKTSDTLIAIDSLDVANVNPEIKGAIVAIESWSNT